MIMMMKNEYCRSNLLLSNEPKNLQLKIARIARVNWENNLIKDALSIDILLAKNKTFLIKSMITRARIVCKFIFGGCVIIERQREHIDRDILCVDHYYERVYYSISRNCCRKCLRAPSIHTSSVHIRVWFTCELIYGNERIFNAFSLELDTYFYD